MALWKHPLGCNHLKIKRVPVGFADVERLCVDIDCLPVISIMNGVFALILQLGNVRVNDRHLRALSTANRGERGSDAEIDEQVQTVLRSDAE